MLEFERGGGMSALKRRKDLDHLKDIVADTMAADATFNAIGGIRIGGVASWHSP